LRKLTLRELDVIAGRMADKVIATRKKAFYDERDAIDEANMEAAKELRKEALAIPANVKKVFCDSVKAYNDRVALKKLIHYLRPKKFKAWNGGEQEFYEHSYDLIQKIKDDLIVQQIDSPDATALQRIVAKKYGVTV
jgi:hypothetical protein